MLVVKNKWWAIVVVRLGLELTRTANKTYR